MFDYIKNKAIAGKEFFVDLVFSKQFGQGLLIGGSIMAAAYVVHVLVRL